MIQQERERDHNALASQPAGNVYLHVDSLQPCVMKTHGWHESAQLAEQSTTSPMSTGDLGCGRETDIHTL